MSTRSRSAAPQLDRTTRTWYFVVDLGEGPDGRRRQARRRGFATKADAQEALDCLRVESRQGTYVSPNQQTFARFLHETWLPSCRLRLAESTMESYERNVRNHIIPALGAVRLQALDGTMLSEFYAALLTSGRKRGTQSPGLKPRTVRYIGTIIHAALDDAVKWRLVQFNAEDRATRPSAKSAKPPEMKVWAAKELRTFLDRTTGDVYGYAWAFLASTGCRRGEALGLRWADVDLNGRAASIRQQVIPLPKASGKGREGRIVPGTKGSGARVVELDTRTVASLRTWKRQQVKQRLLLGSAYQDHGLVFSRPDGLPFHPEAFSKTFDRRLRQAAFADLPVIRLHDLRHTWATLALEAGIDVAVVSKQLGHSSPVITWTTYQHVRKCIQADAAERVADSIFGA